MAVGGGKNPFHSSISQTWQLTKWLYIKFSAIWKPDYSCIEAYLQFYYWFDKHFVGCHSCQISLIVNYPLLWIKGVLSACISKKKCRLVQLLTMKWIYKFMVSLNAKFRINLVAICGFEWPGFSSWLFYVCIKCFHLVATIWTNFFHDLFQYWLVSDHVVFYSPTWLDWSKLSVS